MTHNLLAVPQFLTTPAGVAVLAVVAVLLVVLVIELNYRFFAKYVLDFIFSLVGSIILSPVLIITAVVLKVRLGEVFAYTPYIGVKGKVIYIRSFAGIKGSFKNLPRVLDVLACKLSIVGPKLMEAGDAALMDDEAMGRFAVRPGLISPLVLKGNADLKYEEMFSLDIAYIQKREMFKDFACLICALVYKIRGEDTQYYGETLKSYAQVLLERGTISEEDVKTAREYAEQSLRDSTF